jgi:hypothetical protein
MQSGHFTKYQTNLESVSDEASKIVLFRLCFSTSKIGSQKQLLHPGTISRPVQLSFASPRAQGPHLFFAASQAPLAPPALQHSPETSALEGLGAMSPDVLQPFAAHSRHRMSQDMSGQAA